MHDITQSQSWFTRARALLAILVISELLWPALLSAQSIIPEPNSTGTEVNQNNNTYDITGGVRSSANLFHSFQEFGLNNGETANFLSSPEINNILSRVTGGRASIINGLIQVTGGNSNLFLMNPAGIVFGPNSSLNVTADFIATTANGIGFNSGWFNAGGINQYQQLVGTPSMFRFSGNGGIVNFGNLNVSPGHQLGLLGSTVLNDGSLTAPGGDVVITAVKGESLVNLSQPGHLLSLEVDSSNLENITASNLPELLMGGQVNDANRVVVHNNGTIQLVGSGVQVPTDTGVAVVSGDIDVSDNAAGTVAVLGEKVALVDANINAAGTNGGGNVFIGGDFQGLGRLPNATDTFVDGKSLIAVDAEDAGDGGTAIIWADDTTRFYGNISATGGNFGGDGGKVEVSGKQSLVFRGFVDVTASQGNAGTILFDPKNIRIANGGADDIELNNAFDENATNNVTFDADDITGLTGDVILEANNDITVDEPIFFSGNIDNLELRAGRSININADIDTSGGSGNIVLIGNDDRARATNPYLGDAIPIVSDGFSPLRRTNEFSRVTNPYLGAPNIPIVSDRLISSPPTDELVVVNNRDPGPANITMRTGTRLLSGGGSIEISLGTLGETGNITLADLSTVGGNINITNNGGGIDITAGFLDSSSDGYGGAIALTADGNISTGNIDSSGLYSGGNINLTSKNGAINVGDLNSSAQNIDGGAIDTPIVPDIPDVIVEDPIDYQISRGGGSDGGAIDTQFRRDIAQDTSLSVQDTSLSVQDTSFSVQDTSLSVQNQLLFEADPLLFEADQSFIALPVNKIAPIAQRSGGNGGAIALNAAGDISATSINSYSLGSGSAGSITISSTDGAIDIAGIINATSELGDGGAIALSSAGDISATFIRSHSSGSGSGGKITISSTDGAIDIAENINARSQEGDGGAIALTAAADISATSIRSFSFGSGSGGKITISSTDGVIDIAENINARSSEGDGGAIALTAAADISANLIKSYSLFGGSGGKITISSTDGAIDITEGIDASSQEGDGGAIALNAAGNISTGDINSSSFGSGTAGNINLTSNSGLLNIAGVINSSSNQGNGGSITLTADEINFANNIRSSDPGTLLLQPATTTQGIQIGGSTIFRRVQIGGSTTSNNLDLTQAELQLIDGFESVTIGRNDGTGTINIAGLVNLSNETFDLTLRGGPITFNNGIILRDNGTLTLNTGNVTSPFTETDITIGDNGTLVLDVSGDVGELPSPLVTEVSQVDIDQVTGNVFLNNNTGQALNLGATNITGDLAISNDGNITDTGVINVGGSSSFTTTVTDATITLNQLSAIGPISLNTTGSNADVTVTNATDLDLANSNIGGSLNATATNGEISNSGVINAVSDITLTGDSIALNNDVTSTANITLQPLNPSTTIDIGGETGVFNLSVAELANLSDGFSSITIGRSDGTGTVTVGSLGFSDPVKIQSGTGQLTVNGTITGTDNASVNLSSNQINLNSVITTNNQNITIAGNTFLGSDITLDTGTAAGNIAFTGTIDGNKNLTLNAGTGRVSFTDAIGNSTALNSLIVNSSIISQLTATANTIELNRDVTTTGENVTLNANNQLTTNNITTSGGDISLTSSNGDVTAGNLDSSNPNSVGGAITVNSPTGVVTTGNLTSTGTTGGDITVMAQTSITTGDIDSSGTVGNGGDVFLDPDEFIDVGFINAQGANGIGGNVEIITQGVFRANNTFTDQNGEIASISTAGGGGSGNISLSHGGGDQNTDVPFVVGDATNNGAAGVITTGADNTIPLGSSFPGPVSQGNIQVVTGASPAPLSAPQVSPQLDPEPETPVTETPVTETPVTKTPVTEETVTEETVTEETVTEETVTEPEAQAEVPEPEAQAEVPEPEVQAEVPEPETPAREPEALGEAIATPEEVTPVADEPVEIAIEPVEEKPLIVDIPEPIIVEETSQSRLLEPEETRAIATDLETTSPSSSNSDSESEESESESDYTREQQQQFTTKNTGTIDPGVSEMETNFTQEFAEYSGTSDINTEPISLFQTQKIVHQIHSETGVKPALLYVRFAPTSMSGISDNDPLELILVADDGSPLRKVLSATRSEVLATADDLITYITAPRYRRRTTYLEPAQQFYQWLIAPIKAELDSLGIENIAFIMDQGLRGLPVAALHDGSKFLVETYSVGMMPSLSLTDTRYRNIQNASVLAMGSSEFEQLNPLPAVPTELETITEEIRSGSSFLNEAFTLKNIQSQYADKKYPIVHMATHGEFESGDISDSYIQLWDQKLRLNDIRQLGFHNPTVELLVLSACRTAVGSPEAELGFAGLALQAGVKSAIASLWYVSDEGTFGLMTEFYKQLSTAPIKAEAMRQAQVSMINGNVQIEGGQMQSSRGSYALPESLQEIQHKSLTHPYYWAAFTLIGSPW